MSRWLSFLPGPTLTAVRLMHYRYSSTCIYHHAVPSGYWQTDDGLDLFRSAGIITGFRIRMLRLRRGIGCPFGCPDGGAARCGLFAFHVVHRIVSKRVGY